MELLEAMNVFKEIVNDCIRIGIETGVSSTKRLSSLNYRGLRKRQQTSALPSYYYLTAISKAAGILSARKKSIRRGIPTKDPRVKRSLLSSCYYFKITKNGYLQFKFGRKNTISIPLNSHTLDVVLEKTVEVRSFTIASNSLSLSCVKRQVASYDPRTFLGIDRNASNLTYGNSARAIQFNMKKIEKILKTTRQVVRSFKRSDVRIRAKLCSKYGKRRSERTKQIIHQVSKNVVSDAKQNRGATVFENIEGLRKLFRKGNLQGKNFRARMNSVPWYEIKRQIEYKAAWEGVPFIQLTKDETRGTSKSCPACGERLQEDRSNRIHYRELWCGKCEKWRDRDLVAVMNISHKGWLRFRQSKGEAGEAMAQEPRKEGVLLKVDASKLRNGLRIIEYKAPFNRSTEPVTQVSINYY